MIYVVPRMKTLGSRPRSVGHLSHPSVSDRTPKQLRRIERKAWTPPLPPDHPANVNLRRLLRLASHLEYMLATIEMDARTLGITPEEAAAGWMFTSRGPGIDLLQLSNMGKEWADWWAEIVATHDPRQRYDELADAHLTTTEIVEALQARAAACEQAGNPAELLAALAAVVELLQAVEVAGYRTTDPPPREKRGHASPMSTAHPCTAPPRPSRLGSTGTPPHARLPGETPP